MRPSRHIPVRTCVGCRRRAPQRELLRVAAMDGRAVADRRRRVQGRGAYVCFQDECLDRAVRSGSIARGLRRAVTLDDRDLRGAVHETTVSERR